MKKTIISLSILSLSIFVIDKKFTLRTEAASTAYIGEYAITEPVNEKTKVYIEPQMVNFIKSTGRKVYEEMEFIFFKKYYYYANTFVEKVVDVKRIDNSVDSLIFMVGELENRLRPYSQEVLKQIPVRTGSPVPNISPINKNFTLGYIRSINSTYDTGYGKSWELLAGGIPSDDIIQKINNDESHGLKFNDYFGSFVENDDYNLNRHGKFSSNHIYFKTPLKLIDPLNGQEIDLIHMFASIDGIYKNTGNELTLGNHYERDLLSWNGDLQQAINYLKNHPAYKMNSLFDKNLGASKDDILADIDAMNITKTYMDLDANSIAISLSAYYDIENDDRTKRFKMFINSAILDLEDTSYTTNKHSTFDVFKHEVYYQFNLKEESNGSINNFNYYTDYFVGHGIMKDSKLNIKDLDIKGTMPSEETRRLVVKSFVDFIEDNLYFSKC